MDQLVVLIILGLVGLINWLLQKSAELREKKRLEKQTRPEQLLRPESVSEEDTLPAPRAREVENPRPAEDELRKFLEALGLPPEDSIEPSAPPARPVSKSFEMEVTPAPPPIPVFQMEPVRSIMSEPPARATRPVRPAAARVADARPVPPSSSIYDLLHSPDSLKKAVILSEILGKPKSAI